MTIMAVQSDTELLSTIIGDSAAPPVDLSLSHNAMEYSAQNPSHT
jgi:hypothetical protein